MFEAHKFTLRLHLFTLWLCICVTYFYDRKTDLIDFSMKLVFIGSGAWVKAIKILVALWKTYTFNFTRCFYWNSCCAKHYFATWYTLQNLQRYNHIHFATFCLLMSLFVRFFRYLLIENNIIFSSLCQFGPLTAL